LFLFKKTQKRSGLGGGGGLLVWQILVRFSAFGRRNRGRPLKRLLDT